MTTAHVAPAGRGRGRARRAWPCTQPRSGRGSGLSSGRTPGALVPKTGHQGRMDVPPDVQVESFPVETPPAPRYGAPRHGDYPVRLVATRARHALRPPATDIPAGDCEQAGPRLPSVGPRRRRRVPQPWSYRPRNRCPRRPPRRRCRRPTCILASSRRRRLPSFGHAQARPYVAEMTSVPSASRLIT